LKCKLKPTTAADVSAFTSNASWCCTIGNYIGQRKRSDNVR
jgi:hypothetical protein